MDLFSSLGVDNQGIPKPSLSAPLAVRMRPSSVDEVLGQDHLLEPGSPLRRLLSPDVDDASSVVLWGPPGTGKTTLAYLIARESRKTFVEVSAVSAGVKEVRAVIEEAKRRLFASGEQTVLFVDEVHRFSKTQQDSLLPAVENRWVTLVAATTENPSFSVISPLLSRSILLVLHPLTEEHVHSALHRALEDERGLAGKYHAHEDAIDALGRLSGGDARRALTLLEAAAGVAREIGTTTIEADHVAQAANTALVRWDEDQHYDVASAFIKSMRGSDPDAAIHYLARMIEAGEDPRFIARRVVIAAAEEVGLADTSVLRTAVAAAQAVALIGMPEARIILAEAVLAVAMAPKSNAAYMAIDAALADVRKGNIGAVPMHLRDSHYSGSKGLGHGQGYRYAHDSPHGVAAQQYLPDPLIGTRYYHPTERGDEGMLTKRLDRLREILDMG
ncbi:replication-associated recombination protein A [Actinomycetaceae bacterium WB03_NA08]|uniref:Replication-associated recombination protein A n=1 Tax=Scrofimicrobium canadense TaxID=2652290 RepID=A0A6N7VSK0_9ACTO|nr:replication-associated recombination protein A [Scrofimicrobium canadense]MSS83930.1 replication-associated recombination protein A [Scrofimicrobium canadense]